MWRNRSRISRRPITRTMRLHHWRFTVYQALLGRAGPAELPPMAVVALGGA